MTTLVLALQDNRGRICQTWGFQQRGSLLTDYFVLSCKASRCFAVCGLSSTMSDLSVRCMLPVAAAASGTTSRPLEACVCTAATSLESLAALPGRALLELAAHGVALSVLCWPHTDREWHRVCGAAEHYNPPARSQPSCCSVCCSACLAPVQPHPTLCCCPKGPARRTESERKTGSATWSGKGLATSRQTWRGTTRTMTGSPGSGVRCATRECDPSICLHAVEAAHAGLQAGNHLLVASPLVSRAAVRALCACMLAVTAAGMRALLLCCTGCSVSEH